MGVKKVASGKKRRPAVAERRGQETRAERVTRAEREIRAERVTRAERVSRVVRVQEPGSQTAAARRAAEAQVRTLLDKYVPAHLRLIAAMRRLLRKRLPTAHEVVYEYQNLGAVVISYSPSGQGYEGVLAIRASVDGVKLYFNQGKALPDPEKLLQGSAQARWIAVEGASTLARPAVVRLIEEAISRNKVPFAKAGRGPVVIRSTAGK